MASLSVLVVAFSAVGAAIKSFNAAKSADEAVAALPGLVAALNEPNIAALSSDQKSKFLADLQAASLDVAPDSAAEIASDVALVKAALAFQALIPSFVVPAPVPVPEPVPAPAPAAP